MVLGKLDSHEQKIEIRHYLITDTNIKSKQIKVMNVGPEIIKFLEENMGGNLNDMDLSDIFVDVTLKARETKAKVSKWNYNKLKRLCIAKEPSSKWKGNLLNGRR